VIPGASEAGLNFVGDAETAVVARDLVRLAQIIPRPVRCSTDALYRLGDECGDLTRGRVADDPEYVFGALGRDLLGRA
jgi:hypothetical protein